jgi:TRAP-type uncharacterized transport system substrate-binding protein
VDGLSKPTKLVAFDMDLNSSTKVTDDVVYRVVKAIYENKKDLVAGFPPFGLLEPRNMAKPVEGIQFHSGAIKFYKEAGLWPPKDSGAAAPAKKGDGKK